MRNPAYDPTLTKRERFKALHKHNKAIIAAGPQRLTEEERLNPIRARRGYTAKPQRIVSGGLPSSKR